MLALDTFEKTKPRPRRLGKEDMGSYWREDWTLQTESDITAPFYALVPKDIQRGERRPAVLCPHGYASAGRFYLPDGRDIPVRG